MSRDQDIGQALEEDSDDGSLYDDLESFAIGAASGTTGSEIAEYLWQGSNYALEMGADNVGAALGVGTAFYLLSRSENKKK